MGLRSISLRDFVIVHVLDLELEKGFSVLTGQTGAGKSILIDALQLALGARADAAVVREGAQRCDISAEFDSPAALQCWLEQAGFAGSDTLLLRRTVDVQGKSRAWINGSAATATQLREVADGLVDIHGQHAWQSLTRPDAVRGLLDAYGGVKTDQLSVSWINWRNAQKALAEAHQAQSSLQRERERLAWQIAEVEKLAPLADEWDDLNTQHGRLSNTQTLREACQSALDALQESEQNASSLLSKALTALQAQAHIEPAFQPLLEVLNGALAQTEDAVHSLNSYIRHAELEPQRLQQLDERLSMWINLARRYKRQPAELASLLASWREALQKLDAAADLDKLELAEKHALSSYNAEAQQVSKLRAKAAPALAKAISLAMQGLGMQGGVFDVALHALEQP
ncbi:MAG: AAA family ATPase, partial [Chitinophagaceae bacterium]|nr:AAA family ATPase [Polaromonas sp.]